MMRRGGVDIKDLFLEELSEELGSIGVEPFRAKQIFSWVYERSVFDFDRMTNLSVTSRKTLKDKFYISGLGLIRQLSSGDGTNKFLFALEDGHKVETVFIPSKKTRTVCISSQVGCKFTCEFCASGKNGFIRDLRPAEMISQIMYLKRYARGQFSREEVEPRRELSPVSNVVFMGMGEPLDNYDNVLRAIKIINAPYGLGIGQRKITISTCGLIPAIKRLAGEGLQVELSVSLHSASDKVRSSIMGVNHRYPLKELVEACREYIKKTNRQITFEYVLIKDVNDSMDDARGLAKLVLGMLAKINLISFNPVEGLAYIPAEPLQVKRFKNMLDKKGVVATIRSSKGADIDAACGQLRLRDGKSR